ncbi:hypothetical protein PG985_002284 [Apiospora marii]|uniref:Uncharacterized protein n=1 Tax=Apiospora marii TaxID=335849 RepID=A0ABR1RZ46_9PEZI
MVQLMTTMQEIVSLVRHYLLTYVMKDRRSFPRLDAEVYVAFAAIEHHEMPWHAMNVVMSSVNRVNMRMHAENEEEENRRGKDSVLNFDHQAFQGPLN